MQVRLTLNEEINLNKNNLKSLKSNSPVAALTSLASFCWPIHSRTRLNTNLQQHAQYLLVSFFLIKKKVYWKQSATPTVYITFVYIHSIFKNKDMSCHQMRIQNNHNKTDLNYWRFMDTETHLRDRKMTSQPDQSKNRPKTVLKYSRNLDFRSFFAECFVCLKLYRRKAFIHFESK